MGIHPRMQPSEYQREYGKIILKWISRNRMCMKDCVQNQDLILVYLNLWVPLSERLHNQDHSSLLGTLYNHTGPKKHQIFVSIHQRLQSTAGRTEAVPI
jgi:hypothetical protein